MKISDGFDARRLRSRQPRDWRWRCACVVSVLLMLAGLALGGVGGATLLGDFALFAELNHSPGAALSLLVTGLVLICFGFLVRRGSRRRQLRSGDLSLAPHLLKKQG